MKRAIAAIAVLVVLVVGATVLSEPAEKLPIQDDEFPAILVNSGEKTELKLTIIAPKDVKVGKECEFRVEIENTGAWVEVVYMPGILSKPDLMPARAADGGVPDLGPIMFFGRTRAKDERLNYVVLMGGDIYARSYRWTPRVTGEVTFSAVYENRRDGGDIGIVAWRGKLEARTETLKVAPDERN